MLCPAPADVEQNELVIERTNPPSANGDGQHSAHGSLTWRESFLRAPQPGAPQSDLLSSAQGGKPGKVHTASERQLMGLIITERQERTNSEKALEATLEKALEQERTDRRKLLEELWTKVEEMQVQQMLQNGPGGHHGHRHSAHHDQSGKPEHSEQFNQLYDMATATSRALGELMEALLHHWHALGTAISPGCKPEVQASIQAFHHRVTGIRDSWSEPQELRAIQLQAEVRPEEFSYRIAALEKKLTGADLTALEQKLEDQSSELRCQLVAMEEEIRLSSKGSLMGQAVNEAAASAQPETKSEATSDDKRTSTASTTADSAPELRRSSSFSVKVFEELRKKLKAVEERQEVQAKEIVTCMALRGDVVRLVVNAPLQAVRSHRSALRCVELSPEKRLEMLKALDAKEAVLKEDIARVKERHAALGVTHLYDHGNELKEFDKQYQQEDLVSPSRAKSRGSSVTPLTDIE